MTMSLQDLIDINKRVFGASEPMVNAICPNYPSNYYNVTGDLKNTFLYTGARSVVFLHDINSNSDIYIPFDNYICFGDCRYITGDFVINSIMPQISGDAYCMGWKDNGNGYYSLDKVNLSDNISITQRGYIIRYTNTKVLKIN